jgi:hypothetical protein
MTQNHKQKNTYLHTRREGSDLLSLFAYLKKGQETRKGRMVAYKKLWNGHFSEEVIYN